MELSSGSSASNRTQSTGAQKMCLCGLPAKISQAWTEKNPGRKFYGCPKYKYGDGCKFFRWFDQEEVFGWPKRALIEARDEIWEKKRVIEELKKTILELRRDLEKQQKEIPSIDNDDEEKSHPDEESNREHEWKSKLMDAEAIINRQHIIIIGLTGLFVCAIGAIIYG